MRNSRYRVKQLTLAIGDLLACGLALLLALSLRKLAPATAAEFLHHAPVFVTAFLGWIVINFINGLYDVAVQPKGWAFFRRLSEAGLMSFIITIFFFYLIPTNITPKTILALTIVIGYLLMFGWRALTAGLLTTSTRLQSKVAFVGVTPEVAELVTICEQYPGRGYKPVAYLDLSEQPTVSLPQELPQITTLTDLPHLIREHQIDTVVIAPHLEQDPAIVQKLYTLLFSSVSITDLTSFYELITGRIPPFTFSEGWFLRHLKYRQPTYEKLRALIDVIIGTGLFALLLLLMIPVSLAIKLTSTGPLFIKQARVGKDGKPFTLYKFRTMYALAPDGSAELTGAVMASKSDKRITPIGKILRQLRIDELPQCLNLLRRELTLIGPRPERPEIIAQLEEQMPYYKLRHVVLPGLTGWAVLHQHYADTLEKNLQKLQYDLYYIKNRSFLLDLSILLKTVNVIVRMKGQ